MTQLSASDKRRITKDWAREFPGLTVWKPLRLLRRVGPVVQGVTLNLSSGDAYLPTAHVHALTRHFPTIGMTLPTELRTAGGVQNRIRLKQHGVEVVAEAVERLRSASPFRFEGGFSIEDLVEIYRKEIAERCLPEPSWPVMVNEIEDQVLVPAVVGRFDLVRAGLDFARAIAADWAPGALERWGRDDDWPEGVASLAARRKELETTVENEVAAHQLEELPFVPLS